MTDVAIPYRDPGDPGPAETVQQKWNRQFDELADEVVESSELDADEAFTSIIQFVARLSAEVACGQTDSSVVMGHAAKAIKHLERIRSEILTPSAAE